MLFKVKNTIVFFKIHPVNYLAAILLAPFYDVMFWRKEYIPDIFLSAFKQIYMPGSFSQEYWVGINANIFNSFKSQFPFKKFINRFYITYKANKYDLTIALMQRIALKYEQSNHFHELIQIYTSKHIQDTRFRLRYCNYQELHDCSSLGFDIDTITTDSFFNFNIYLDKAWSIVINVISFMKLITKLLRALNLNKKKIRNRPKIVWFGISEAEIPSKPNSLDITKIAGRCLDSMGDSLYIFPKCPNNAQKKWLHDQKVQWLSIHDLISQLSFREKTSMMLSSFGLLVYPFNNKGGWKLLKYIYSDILHLLPLFEYLLGLNKAILLTSQAAGAIENPIVSMLRQRGFKTVWWFYAGVGSKAVPRELPGTYLMEQVEESFTLAEEKWIWFPICKEMLLARRLHPTEESETKFVTLGPLMSGDPGWLLHDTKTARELYQFKGSSLCTMWITVFDIPTYSDYALVGHRWPVGPIDSKIQSAFFNSLLKILKQFPTVGIIYKPKRDQIVSRPNQIWNQRNDLDFFDKDIIYAQEGRLIFLPHDIDPYIPISLCDHGIATPYTTALLAVIATGKDSIYLDVTGRINNTCPDYLNDLTVNNIDELEKKIIYWLNGQNEISSELSNDLCNPKDIKKLVNENIKRLTANM